MQEYLPGTRIPAYIKEHLDMKENNVLINYAVLREYGESGVINELAKFGINVKLSVIQYGNQIGKYPKENTYVLEKI